MAAPRATAGGGDGPPSRRLTTVILLVALASLVWWHWLSTPGEGDGQRYAGVAEVLRDMRASPGFTAAQVGFCLLDPDGEVVVDVAANRALQPASTLKTLTTATALEHFGPEFRFRTGVGLTAEVGADGSLDGDIVVVGGGDPTLGEAGLAELVEAVWAAGVRRVTGRVVADARVFPEPAVSDFWNWGDVGNAYGAPVCGVNYERNQMRVRFRPGKSVGAPSTFLGATLEVPGVEWDNRVVTGEVGSGDGVVVYGGPYAAVVTLRGTVPLGESPFSVGAALPDPPRFVATRLRSLLIERGVVLDGAPVTSRELRGEVPAVIVAAGETASAPLREIARHINEVSDNVEAQALFLAFGAGSGGDPGAVLRGHWEGRGLTWDGLRIEDGSGLARANHVRPVDLARVNHLAASGPVGEAFFESLNVGFDGRVRWKGGAMSGVRAYVGFVEAENGERFTFCLMVNHDRADAETLAGWRTAVVEAMLAL